MRTDFVLEMSEIEMLGTYNRLNNESTLKLFRYLYTNLLASLAVAKKDEEDLIKGRLLQISGMIDSIETAEEALIKIEAIMERKAKRSKVLEEIKNKLAFRRN